MIQVFNPCEVKNKEKTGPSVGEIAVGVGAGVIGSKLIMGK